MSATKQQVCPVVGTTNSVLPPSHPDVDLSADGQVCPVVGASTDHHHNLHKHPKVPISDDDGSNAQACPVLKQVVQEPQSKAMDDELCPVVGSVTTILPPNHPSTKEAQDGDICPVTKAKVGHHKDKVHEHPQVDSVTGVCPVVGAKA